MRIETALNVQRLTNNQIITTRYEQWVDPKTLKHEQRVEVYVLDLYTSRGKHQTYTNNNSIDVIA